jgi:hypothetical protein
MKKFIKTILLFLIPFLILLAYYIVLDPFMVIKKYDKFYDSDSKGWVGLNRDYISTTTFDNNYRKRQYNSFIFGNSRSLFYQVSDWKNHLTANSNCYHFDASRESLYGLYKKVKYIDSKNLKIKNALVILDYVTLSQEKPKAGHLYIISPLLENYSNILLFHLEFLKAFLSPKFLFAYFDFRISGKVKPYMKKGDLIDDRPMKYDITWNEIRFDVFEDLISKGKYYNEERMKSFIKKDTLQTISPVAITEKQKKILKEILDVFHKHKTDYKIIISPQYNQVKLNTRDLYFLIQLFGEKNVYDFSGKNKFTIDYHDYYERSHYRPHIAREIMTIIYKND